MTDQSVKAPVETIPVEREQLRVQFVTYAVLGGFFAVLSVVEALAFLFVPYFGQFEGVLWIPIVFTVFPAILFLGRLRQKPSVRR
jgi:hypothetical protein